MLISSDVLAFQEIVSGRVQGVFFHASLKHAADENSAAGWVRNLKGGRVEALTQGKKSDVERVLEGCRKGSDGAKVDDVRTT